MSTRAENFRAAAERTHKPSKKAKARSAAKAAKAKAPTAATARLSHNDAHRVDKKSTYAIEPDAAHPSRKSTRSSSNRAKTDSALRLTARIRNASPEARATRKSGNPN